MGGEWTFSITLEIPQFPSEPLEFPKHPRYFRISLCPCINDTPAFLTLEVLRDLICKFIQMHGFRKQLVALRIYFIMEWLPTGNSVVYILNC